MSTLIQKIAATYDAYLRTTNNEWHLKHLERLHELEKMLPSGSGFDIGTTLDRDASQSGRLVFKTAFHHMNGRGYYDGWTKHKVIVRPTFVGIDLRVTGRDRNGIKEYIAEVFHEALSQEG